MLKKIIDTSIKKVFSKKGKIRKFWHTDLTESIFVARSTDNLEKGFVIFYNNQISMLLI